LSRRSMGIIAVGSFGEARPATAVQDMDAGLSPLSAVARRVLRISAVPGGGFASCAGTRPHWMIESGNGYQTIACKLLAMDRRTSSRENIVGLATRSQARSRPRDSN
jgi:hypothetical protein